MSETKKIGVREILIVRREGTVEECGVLHTVKSYGEASRVLSEMAHTAPDQIGYHKVSFTVTFEDGELYRGQVSLQREHVGGYQIGESIEYYQLYRLGYRCPKGWTEEQYQCFLANRTAQGEKAQREKFLETYQLRDEVETAAA